MVLSVPVFGDIPTIGSSRQPIGVIGISLNRIHSLMLAEPDRQHAMLVEVRDYPLLAISWNAALQRNVMIGSYGEGSGTIIHHNSELIEHTDLGNRSAPSLRISKGLLSILKSEFNQDWGLAKGVPKEIQCFDRSVVWGKHAKWVAAYAPVVDVTSLPEQRTGWFVVVQQAIPRQLILSGNWAIASPRLD